MKKFKLKLIVAILLLNIGLGSCSIYKKKLSRGYTVIWNNSRHISTQDKFKTARAMPISSRTEKFKPNLYLNADKTTLKSINSRKQLKKKKLKTVLKKPPNKSTDAKKKNHTVSKNNNPIIYKIKTLSTKSLAKKNEKEINKISILSLILTVLWTFAMFAYFLSIYSYKQMLLEPNKYRDSSKNLSLFIFWFLTIVSPIGMATIIYLFALEGFLFFGAVLMAPIFILLIIGSVWMSRIVKKYK